WVVHGAGLDEIALSGPTTVAAIENGSVRAFEVGPEDAGLPRADAAALRGGEAATNAEIAGGVLQGARGPRRDVVVLNAAAALLVAGRAADLREGAALAAAAIDDGRAAALLDRVRESSRA